MEISEIRKDLLPVFEKYKDCLVFAYLFGSVARNQISPMSDIDIAVFLSNKGHESYVDVKLALYGDLCRTLVTI